MIKPKVKYNKITFEADNFTQKTEVFKWPSEFEEVFIWLVIDTVLQSLTYTTSVNIMVGL